MSGAPGTPRVNHTAAAAPVFPAPGRAGQVVSAPPAVSAVGTPSHTLKKKPGQRNPTQKFSVYADRARVSDIHTFICF